MATTRSKHLDAIRDGQTGPGAPDAGPEEEHAVYPEHPVYRGLRFSDGNLTAALQILDVLEAEGPTEYDLAGDGIVVMPKWMLERLLPVLRERGVPHDVVRVVSISELPPERQAELRFGHWRRE